ncbi:MAG: hypothetical protein IH840_17295 [Candidatus Heimdallarchaeota archaeon]|nr:hypothetical protein [Candidatus Heimdallarchaeota archaeon]
MVSGSKRIQALARNVMLLNALGDIVTIQIDLLDITGVEDLLIEEFNDAEGNGLFVNGMILQRILDSSTIDYFYVFNKLAEITGDYDSIDGVTALIRVMYRDDPIEITVQLTGDQKNPQLLQVTDQSVYFNLLNLIQTRWTMASLMR